MYVRGWAIKLALAPRPSTICCAIGGGCEMAASLRLSQMEQEMVASHQWHERGGLSISTVRNRYRGKTNKDTAGCKRLSWL
jgi:hypothetical protein